MVLIYVGSTATALLGPDEVEVCESISAELGLEV